MAILNGKYRVKNSQNNYDIVYLETGANQVKFDDGKTFQQKLDEGTLKGEKGDTGAKGDKGEKGETGAKGADGLTTSVTVNGIKYTHSNGNITIPNYPSTPASIGAEPANTNIQAHISSNHAPANAQKNSDITKEEIEAKLTGSISSHNHSDIYYDKNTVNEIVDNVSQELNEKIDSIKDSSASNISYTCDINTWVSESGLYKATVEHLLNTEKVVVNAYSNVTKESLFVHYRILSPTSIEIESSLNEDTKIIVINGEKEIQSIELDIPINDNELSGIKTWSSSKIKEYVDNSTPTLPDFTASEIAYGKNECSNVDTALDKIFEKISIVGGEMPVVSNVVMNNLTHSGTYDLTYTVTGGDENEVYAHRLTIDSVNHDFIPFKDGNTYTYHGTNLTPGKTHICRVFVSDGNRTSSSELFSVQVPQADIYGFSYNEKDSNPSTSISYIEGATGLSGASATDFGDWEHRFPFNEIKPCGFKDGKVFKYIDKNNFLKYVDGTDVGTDVDVMIQFPRIYWKATKTSSGGEIRISPVKKEGYECYAHNQNGNEKEFIYIGAYLSSSSYDSKSGTSPASTVIKDTIFTNITSQKGTGYTLYTYHMNTMLQILFTLLYKTLNTREILGTTNNGTTGETDELGMNGRVDKSNKFLGLQNICGSNRLNFLAGATYQLNVANSNASNKIVAIHTNDTNVGISASYNGGHTPTNLNYLHAISYGSSSSKSFKTVAWSNSAPFAPSSDPGGSNTTYFCSKFFKNGSNNYSGNSLNYLGFANYETIVGTRTCSIAGDDKSGHSTTQVSYRLAYI